MRLQQGEGFVDFAVEVRWVRKQLSVIDHLFVQQHARDTGSELLAKHLVDGGIDRVTDEVVSVLLVGRRETLLNLCCIHLGKRNTVLRRSRPILLRILLLIRSSLRSVGASVLLGTTSASLLSSSWIWATTPGEFVVSSVLLIGSRLLKMLLLLHFVPIII